MAQNSEAENKLLPPPEKKWCECGHLLRDHDKTGRCLAGTDDGGCLCRNTKPCY